MKAKLMMVQCDYQLILGKKLLIGLCKANVTHLVLQRLQLPGNWLFFSLSSEDVIEDFTRIFKVENFMKFLSLKLSNYKVFHKSPCLSGSLKLK